MVVQSPTKVRYSCFYSIGTGMPKNFPDRGGNWDAVTNLKTSPPSARVAAMRYMREQNCKQNFIETFLKHA